MPDPALYLAAIGAAGLVAVLLVAAIGWRPKANRDKNANSTRGNLAATAGMAGGLIAGYWVLDLYVSWPPVNALDRFLTIILPSAVIIELVAAIDRVPRWLAWTLRMLLVSALGRVLIHGSIYVASAQAAEEMLVHLAACAVLTAGLWALVTGLAARSPPGISVSIALALTMVCSGGLIMFSGYVSGGAATLPPGAALVATVGASSLLARRANMQGPLGLGVVSLSGLLFIGRYFGGLSTGVAVALLLAPLLCWTTELPSLLRRKGSVNSRP